MTTWNSASLNQLPRIELKGNQDFKEKTVILHLTSLKLKDIVSRGSAPIAGRGCLPCHQRKPVLGPAPQAAAHSCFNSFSVARLRPLLTRGLPKLAFAAEMFTLWKSTCPTRQRFFSPTVCFQTLASTPLGIISPEPFFREEMKELF